MRLKSLLFLVSALLVSTACATGADPGVDGDSGGGSGVATGAGGAPVICAPGKQDACTCTDGSSGAQVCNANGTAWGPCTCSGSGSGGASSVAASSGSASTSSTSGSGGASSTVASSSSGPSSSSSSSSAISSSSAVSSSSAASSSSGGPTDDPEACPGIELFFSGGIASVSDDTTPYSNDYSGGGSCISTAGQGKEIVYRFVAPKSGTMNVLAEPIGFTAVVYYSAGSCNPNAPISCKTNTMIGAPLSFTVSVTQGTTYYFFMDGWTQSVSGPFTLTFTLP